MNIETYSEKKSVKKILVLTVLLMALTGCTAPGVSKPEPMATGNPQVNMPNPASVYCAKQGNRLEIHTAADGSQSGVCVFPDGSICDEWAYFRGECGSKEQKSPAPAMTAVTSSKAVGDTAGENNAGSSMPAGAAEKVTDWWGVIKRTPPGAQYDDYFERQDLKQIISFGIDSKDPKIQAQIQILRDSGKIVHLYGTLLSQVPDYNGSQILVDRVEVEP